MLRSNFNSDRHMSSKNNGVLEFWNLYQCLTRGADFNIGRGGQDVKSGLECYCILDLKQNINFFYKN